VCWEASCSGSNGTGGFIRGIAQGEYNNGVLSVGSGKLRGVKVDVNEVNEGTGYGLD